MLIQTYSPGHYALAHVTGHDTRAFIEAELAIRSAGASPPFISQALVWVSAPRADRAQALARHLAHRLRGVAAGSLRVLGAAEAPIRRLHGRYRWMIALRAKNHGPIHRALRDVLDAEDFKPGPRERVVVDMDPYNLL